MGNHEFIKRHFDSLEEYDFEGDPSMKRGFDSLGNHEFIKRGHLLSKKDFVKWYINKHIGANARE